MKLRSLFSIVLVLGASGALAAGCGGSSVTPVSGNANLGLVGLLYEDLGADHIVGTTPCPTDAGTITFINHSTADDAVVDIAGASSPIVLRVETDGTSIPFTATTLAPMERVDVAVQFNCDGTADVSQPLTMSAVFGTDAPVTATATVVIDVSE